MARKQPKITVKAYVHVGDQLVDVDTLTPAQRDYLGACLQVGMLNGAYRGKARFWADLPPKEEVFPPEKGGNTPDHTRQTPRPSPCGQR